MTEPDMNYRQPSKLVGDAIILERAARVIRQRSSRFTALVIARVLERQAEGLRASGSPGT